MKYVILSTSTNISQLRQEYSLPPNETDFLPLYEGRGKLSTAEKREYFAQAIEPKIKEDCKYIIVSDGEWYKALYKPCKPLNELGYLREFKDGKFIVYIPSIKKIFYDPSETRKQIAFVIHAILQNERGSYTDPGQDIIKNAYYPKTMAEKAETLKNLLNEPALTCDIETYGLKHYDAGLATICFCKDKHSGVAFQIDPDPNTPNIHLRSLLRHFFDTYKGKLIFHNISFDAYILTYALYMGNFLDTAGMLRGLDSLLKNFDDTLLITYLATNSTAGNHLSLKEQSQEYAGNYAKEEIGDITKIPLDELLTYNLTDGLATWYVYEKWYSVLVQDNQQEIYENIFKPAVKDIIQMQLVGLPLDMNRVLEVEKILENDKETALKKIYDNPIIINFTKILNEEWVKYKNSIYKKKQVTIDDAHEQFNPNSNVQLKKLFYTCLHLPVLGTTPKGEPSTDGSTLAALINHTKDENIKNLLQALIDYSDVIKILTAFIPAFKKAYKARDGWHYLCGNFRLGGTVSGRLSSNSPNLQQIPATGSKYAKIIKSCFKAPIGYLFVGMDFSSLEDRISALTTKDPEKLKVYTDGYDGHCLRAYAYFHDQMPDIKSQMEEVKKEGKLYKVTYEDGTTEYLNEHNPKLKELL